MSFWSLYFLALSVTLVGWVINNRRLLDAYEFVPVAIVASIPWVNFVTAIFQCVFLALDEWAYYEFHKKKKK